MEPSAAVPGFGILVFAGGFAVGLLFAMFALPAGRRAKALEAELEQTKKTHDAYREEVTGHFQKSSELFADMTQSYKAVYDHLAGGAQELCDPPDPGKAVAFRSSRLIEIDDHGEPVARRSQADRQSKPNLAKESASAEAEVTAEAETEEAPVGAPQAPTEAKPSGS